jgi:predicted N-acetyltransferase YhbS
VKHGQHGLRGSAKPARTLDIRPSRPADAAELSALAHRAKASWGYPSTWMDRWNQALTLTRAYLKTHPGFVAEHDGKIVGMCMLELRLENARLEHVWIDPDYQRQGIGRAIIARALEEVAESGARFVVIESDPFAEQFYLKLGAHRTGFVRAPMPGAPDRILPVLELETSANLLDEKLASAD